MSVLRSGSIMLLFATCGTIASAQSELTWTSGAGMTLCRQLPSLADTDLVPWVQGYWTGANLYLGGTDLCLERAQIDNLGISAIRTLIEVQCEPIPDHPIMFAAFNALKGLPKIAGAKAAACGEK